MQLPKHRKLKPPSPDTPGRPAARRAPQPDGSSTISACRLKRLLDEYLYDGAVSLRSPRTLETRRLFIRNLLWFLEHRDYTACGVSQLREFFFYLGHGHEEAGGRFGHRHLNRPVRPITVQDYYVCLRAFFDWIVASGELASTPFAAIAKPKVQKEVKPPLSPDQLRRLFLAASHTADPLRDTALLYWLLDTGCRASETVGVRLGDLDLRSQSCQVRGKGNKYRTVYFGTAAAQALRRYLQASGATQPSGATRRAAAALPGETPLFLSCRGVQPLTRSGLLQLVEHLARAAQIRGACSPHAFRRTFAVHTLRNGANVFSVQAMLGHSDLQMTQRYCALAQADVEAQHRRYSPGDSFELAKAASAPAC